MRPTYSRKKGGKIYLRTREHWQVMTKQINHFEEIAENRLMDKNEIEKRSRIKYEIEKQKFFQFFKNIKQYQEY